MSGSSSATAIRSERFMAVLSGKVMTISAPGPVALADGDPAPVGLDDPPGDGHAQAGPLGLGGVERLEDPPPLLRAEPRPVVADGDAERAAGRRARPARSAISTSTGSGQAARAFSRMLRKTCPSRNGSTRSAGRAPSIASRSDGRSARRAAGSRCAQASRQTSRQVAGAALQPDRGRVAADVLVEVVEVVLGLLEPGDEVERLGAVLDLQGEHLQAGLAALQGVAALVGQPGDHLADGGQPLGLQRPLLGLLQVGDVLADDQDRRAAPRSRRR